MLNRKTQYTAIVCDAFLETSVNHLRNLGYPELADRVLEIFKEFVALEKERNGKYSRAGNVLYLRR